MLASAASAAVPSLETYVEARAAEMQGDSVRSAQLYAAMAAANPADTSIARRAIATAIQSGQTDLAVSLARRQKPGELAVDARLLLAADSLRRGKTGQAVADLQSGVTSTEAELFAPLVRAWERTERRKADGAATLATLPAASPLASIADEHRAAMLFALGDADQALPIARKVVERGGGRNSRLRLAYADALVRLKRPNDAMAMLVGGDEALAIGRGRVAAGKPLNMAIATPAEGYAELLVALAVDLGRDDQKELPISLAQVARHAAPKSSQPVILLGLLLDGDGRDDDALRALRAVPRDDLLVGDALDIETRLLTDRKQFDEALRVARAATGTTGTAADYARLGNILGDMDRHPEAASAYGEAIARLSGDGGNGQLWTLRLLRAASLEQAERWPEAKQELETAMRSEPENPILLNFLGYGKLERGEDLDAAEAMIRKASALRPEDASITDSLGWALFKRGRLPEAISTLRRAAAGDPTQAEIHEHLGDALFTSGRRIEARFSWEAALLTAEDKAKMRLKGKIEAGLSPANAAP
jgi:tetratricopeptide (TPR) repeat protein